MSTTDTDSLATRQLIVDTANKIFSQHCDKALLDASERGEFAAALWQQIADNGFNLLGTAASGTTSADAHAFVQACGRFAVPLPIAETLLVNQWHQPVERVSSIGLIAGDEIVEVPWGRQAGVVLGVSAESDEVVVVENPQVLRQGTNLAGEPCDVIALHSARTLTIPDAYAQLALTRISLMAGVLQTLLDLGLQFANERVQFGRAISKFQAIQHSLAVVASEVAAARRAADAAVDAQAGERFLLEVAASKARVGEAVGLVAEQVHQIHGAMGFTHEHRLHHFSRRAWAWRDDYGNEFHWQGVLGRHLARQGADQAWHFIATQA